MSANFAEVCVRGAGPSGIDLAGLPPLPDPDALEEQARSLSTAGEAVLAGVSEAAGSWQKLSGVYEAPEAAQVKTGFTPVMVQAREVQSVTSAVSASLRSYAERSRALKAKVAAMTAEVDRLDEVVLGNDDWQSNLGILDQHRDTSNRVSALAQEILNSDAECASSLNAMVGGDEVTAPVIPRSDLNGSTDGLSNVLSHVQHFFGGDRKLSDQPWGPATPGVRLGGVWTFLQGGITSGIGGIQGLYTLVGTTDKVENASALRGLGTVAVAAFTTHAVIRRGFKDVSNDDMKALMTVGEVGKSMVHADEWSKDPAFAAGATTFDVASLFVGGGVAGAGAKAGHVAGRAGIAVDKLSISIMDRPGLGKASDSLAGLAQDFYTADRFIAKPGSLALKLAGLTMPQTTMKTLNAMTNLRINTFMAASRVPPAMFEHAMARPLDGGAAVLSRFDTAFPSVAMATPHGAVPLGGPVGSAAETLMNGAAKVRADHVPLASRIAAVDKPTPSVAFPKPDNIRQTVVLRHDDLEFPLKKTDNFAARTGLQPNTEYIIESRTLTNHVNGTPQKTLEKFYTDDHGTVNRVDTFAGVKGYWNPELNKPLPNVTYNVVANVDGGLKNTFTIVTDDKGHMARMSGHITSTLVGNMNRNGWQQLIAGRLGGPGYDGGHAAPSGLGFVGEKGGLFPHHQWQNRLKGPENDSASFHETELAIIDEVKKRQTAGRDIDLDWKMDLVPSNKPGLPATVRLRYAFDGAELMVRQFNNLVLE